MVVRFLKPPTGGSASASYSRAAGVGPRFPLPPSGIACLWHFRIDQVEETDSIGQLRQAMPVALQRDDSPLDLRHVPTPRSRCSGQGFSGQWVDGHSIHYAANFPTPA